MAGTTVKSLTLEVARRELGLGKGEFILGIENGVIRTCWSGDELCVKPGEVARWCASPGELAELTRLVHASEAAELAGISRHRFDQLVRGGVIRPVRSYTNRYHAEVWQYSAADVRQLPERRPEFLGTRLPGPFLAELAIGADRRAEGHRSRLRAQALLMLRDPWVKAAAWSHWIRSAQPPAELVQVSQAEAVHLARRAVEEGLTVARPVRAACFWPRPVSSPPRERVGDASSDFDYADAGAAQHAEVLGVRRQDGHGRG
ncbi:DUF6397 family protein [Streptomyces sp. NPDC020298]|uniref:DUF6397 family protein n=1 Tax=unclassified Streptomyces TaxID=2593676 RepID=UPI0033D033A8